MEHFDLNLDPFHIEFVAPGHITGTLSHPLVEYPMDFYGYNHIITILDKTTNPSIVTVYDDQIFGMRICPIYIRKVCRNTKENRMAIAAALSSKILRIIHRVVDMAGIDISMAPDLVVIAASGSLKCITYNCGIMKAAIKLGMFCPIRKGQGFAS